jgi:hypothetical protein
MTRNKICGKVEIESPPPFGLPVRQGRGPSGREGDVAFSPTRRHMTCGLIYLLAYLKPQAAVGRDRNWLVGNEMAAGGLLADIETGTLSPKKPNTKRISPCTRKGKKQQKEKR